MADDLLALWEAVDEREQKIESMRGVRRDALWSAGAPEEKSLEAALRRGHVFTSGELKQLAVRRYAQPVLSLYLNLSPARRRGRPEHMGVLDAMCRDELAARRLQFDRLPASDQLTMRRDLHEIEDLAGGAVHSPGCRSLLAFKSGAQLNRALTLPVRVVSSFTIDTAPHVERLMGVLEEHAKTLAVEVREARSHFWTEYLDHLEEVQTLDSAAAADPGEAGRARADQRQATQRQWHLMATARLAGQLYADLECANLVLSGDGAAMLGLEPLLPEWLRARIIGRLLPAPGRDRAHWHQQIQRVMMDHRRVVETAALARLADSREAGLATSGLTGVLEVVNRFLARQLFVSAELRQAGFVCRQHHYLALRGGICPFCGASLLEADNLGDELVEFARLHGVEVMRVEAAPELLVAYRGVAAVRYDFPVR